MIRPISVALAATAALALASCGSGGGDVASSVAPETAKTTVERAAKVRLAAASVPEEARDQGLETYYTNAATAPQDKQAVALFVLEDADVAGKVSHLVKSSTPDPSRLIVRGNVMVVYASAGKDRGAAVAKAIEAL